ncbi:MAG TPA: DNA alkylation repair protein [Anaerolineales bacterium]|nr:DNA alkylation repair protein [Anaerolineales bacterium]
MSRAKFQKYHREVAQALTSIGNPAFGKAVQKDRGSHLKHLGIKFPELRRRVKQGFSFYALPEEQILEIWDALWQTSPYGDVLFAALEYYIPIVKKQVPANLWGVVKGWSLRIDNWCHSDALCSVYSRILEGNQKEVYPQLLEWNQAQSEWLRRISLISLIHYSGKNAVFMPPKKVLPLVSNCLDDERYYVQTAVGWVLREMGQMYQGEIQKYLEIHVERLSSPAFSRSIERLSTKERTHLQGIRKRRMA